MGETRGERGDGERQWVKRARSKTRKAKAGGKAWGKSERKLRPPQGGLQRTPCLRSPQPTLTEPAGEMGSDFKYRIKTHPRGVHFSLYNFVRFRGESLIITQYCAVCATDVCRTLHLQNKVAFMKIKQPVLFHFAELKRKSAALHRKIIRKLLTGEGNVKFIFAQPLRFCGKVGHEL